MDRILKISLGSVLASLGAWTTGPALAQDAPPGSAPSRSATPVYSTPAPPRPIAAAQAADGGRSYPTSQFPGGITGPYGPLPGQSGVGAPGMPGAAGPGAAGGPAGSPTGEPLPYPATAGGGAAGGAGAMAGAGTSAGAGGMSDYGTSMGAGANTLADALADGSGSGFSPAAGGVQSGAPSAFTMLGDQAPIFGRPTLPGAPHQPGSRNELSPALVEKAKTVVPYVRAMKFSDNQSPIPQDRVFFNFNYYNNLNYATNRQLGAPVSGIEVYRYVLGVEKTIFGGMASLGLSESLNSLSARSPYQGVGGTSTAMGDLNLFGKFILWQRWETGGNVPALGGFGFPAQYPGGRNGGLISGGLQATLPTGPGSFAGAPFSKSYRSTTLQPYLGYFFSRGDFYLHGFESIAVPTDPNDVTNLYSDVGMGYYLYRNPDLDTFLTAFAPIFEVHVNVPLNHRDFHNIYDPVGTYDVVDLTLGANLQFGQRTVLTLAAVTPTTGPRPFSVEAMALLNVYFGGRRIAPPMAGR